MTDQQRKLLAQGRCIWCAAPSKQKECVDCRRTQGVLGGGSRMTFRRTTMKDINKRGE